MSKKLRKKKLEDRGYISHTLKYKFICYYTRLKSYMLYNFINLKLDIV